MKKACLSSLPYLFLAVLMMAMTGCGAGNSAIKADNAAPGSASVSVAYPAAKVAAAVATPVSLQFTVTGTGLTGNPIPVVRSTSTDTTGGTITGIYPGTVTVGVTAVDATGAVVYEGYALKVVVAPNATTNVGTINLSVPVVKAQDSGCVKCHETTLDISGLNLVADFKQSGHYTNQSYDLNAKFGITGTGCAGCHGPSHNDPTPSASGRCYECHGPVLNPVHFNNMTSETPHAAEYVTTNYQNNCSACHEPHNPLRGVGAEERKAWAESSHGDVNGPAFTEESMVDPGQAACQRCHTATGFKNFALSNFKNFPTTSNFGPNEKKREVLACDACHTNNGFDVRQPGPFTSSYKLASTGAPATFPDVGESNLCIACHSARENGVNDVTNFNNASFKNSHYLGAAATMYMSAGFTQFTSASAAWGTSTYGKSLTPDNKSIPAYGIAGGVTSTHRIFGTPALVGDKHNPSVFVAGSFDANGPCVTCHLNANGAPTGTRQAHGHSLEIDGNAYRQVCSNCHTSENGVALTADNFKQYFVEPNSEAFQNSLALLKKVLADKTGITYDPNTYPYFFKNGAQVKDWTLGTGNTVFGKKLMGACFNLQLLYKDPAAYAHARSYSRRLVYDSIDFLDDGVMNGSTGATALASGMTDGNGHLIFVKDTKAYNTANGSPTTIYGTTSEAMLYLIGWSRGDGTWANPERP